MSGIREAVTRIVRESNAKVVLGDARDYDRPLKEIGIDSLDMMSILLAVSERYGVDIPDDEIDNLHTLNAVVGYVEKAREGA